MGTARAAKNLMAKGGVGMKAIERRKRLDTGYPLSTGETPKSAPATGPPPPNSKMWGAGKRLLSKLKARKDAKKARRSGAMTVPESGRAMEDRAQQTTLLEDN